MWRSMIKVALATAAFGVVHSALAIRAAKCAASELFGKRNRNGLYRLFYNGQSVASCALLAAYIYKQPNREFYRVPRPLALVMHGGHVMAVIYATSAAYQVGISRIVGLESFIAWLGNGPVPPEPEAQGPALDVDGMTRSAGPFAWSRHPLNLIPLPIFWLWPRMSTSLFAFNATATAYLIIGSLHEEARLKEAYGERYLAYRDSTPYYLPKVGCTRIPLDGIR